MKRIAFRPKTVDMMFYFRLPCRLCDTLRDEDIQDKSCMSICYESWAHNIADNIDMRMNRSFRLIDDATS